MGLSVRVAEVERAVERLADAVDPGLLSTGDAARLLADVERVSRRLRAVQLRLAARAEAAAEWRAKGFRSPEEWLAQVTGTRLGAATKMFETARQLEDLPDTAEALAKGELSVDEAAEVASAADVAPEAEAALLDVARRDGLVGVRREAERVKAAALDLEEQHRRAHRARHLRKIPGRVGELAFAGSLPTANGSRVWSALEVEAKRLFEQARGAGRRESQDAYMLDALVNLVTGARPGAEAGGCRPVPPRPDRAAFLRVDVDALERGRVEPGDVCEVVGAGPVPVPEARAWLADADLWLLFLRSEKVESVVHLGRQVTEAQRVALYERAGFACENEGCNVAHGLEIDHVTGWAVTRRTQLDDLALWCHEDHYRKTYLGWTVEGPPGHRRLVPPRPATSAPDRERADPTRPDTGIGAGGGEAARGMVRAGDALRDAIGRMRPTQPGLAFD